MLALSSAIASGQAELTRLQSEEQSLQQQVNSGIAQAMMAAAPAPAIPATYAGGKLLQPVSGAVTSPFGNRFDPYYHVWQLHAGLDIGAPTGTSIVAAAPGRVTQAGWSGGYGNYTCIDHGLVNGQRVSTCYAHQQKILVSPGQQVSAGQVIGQVGSTGASTGPHLHFEVRLGGRAVDPMPWL
jgi:murein DD-endopeptidase MepM/ murein hydrolase activator NlpD